MIPTNADFEPLLMAILESPEALSVTDSKIYRNIQVTMQVHEDGAKIFEWYTYLGGQDSISTHANSVEELLNNLKSFDPEAKKKARLAELKKEIEQLEGQR